MNQQVEAWLDVALRNADPARRMHLRAEILDHLAEAQAAYAAQGLDPAAAQARALADLGDPRDTARALRDALPRPLSARLADAWMRRRAGLCFGLLALLASWVVVMPFTLPAGNEVDTVTGMALILQVAALTLGLSLPLLFDDLDLSTGVVVMLGVYLLRQPATFLLEGSSGLSYGNSFWLADQPDQLPRALAFLSIIGGGIGLLHGVMVTFLRLPAIWVTLAGGVSIAAFLLQRPGIQHLTLPSLERVPALMPTLAIFGIALGVLIGGTALVARAAQQRIPPVDPAPAPFQWRDLMRDAYLLLPLMLSLAHVRLLWGGPSAFLLLALACSSTFAGALWMARSGDAAMYLARRRRLERFVPALLALSIGGGAWLTANSIVSFVMSLLFAALWLSPLALVTALAAAAILRALWFSRGRRWLGLTRPVRQATPARIVALTLNSALAATIGGCIAAQGLRDGTFVHATAFYALTPLLGLVIGGQHRLPLRTRLIGAVLGALVVGGFVSLGGDNLDGYVGALLLAGLLAGFWNGRPQPEAPERQQSEWRTQQI